MDISELAGLAGPDTIVLSAPTDVAAIARLHERERPHVARAIEKRQREFATGRVLARTALGRLGWAEVPIPSDEDRSPIWPDGIAGSISHCDTRAVVAVRRRDGGTVGIDIEHRSELKTTLWSSVFLPEELDRLGRIADPAHAGRIALVLFSAKEALYKAQYPRTRTYMGFSELLVELEDEGLRGFLRCTFRNDVGSFARGTVVRGRFDLGAFDGPEIVTAVTIDD